MVPRPTLFRWLAPFRVTASVAMGMLVSSASLGAQISEQVLHAFTAADGAHPFYGGLIEGSDGNFYGTTFLGGGFTCFGDGGCGTVFRMTPDGAVTVLHEFTGGTDGIFPPSGVIEAADGSFYGTADSGGDFGFGTIFQVTADGAFNVVHAFSGGTDGGSPIGPLILALDGNFYGTGRAGGSGCPGAPCGTIFRMTPDGTLETLHIFAGNDGANPYAGLTQANDANFYGTTLQGGGSGCDGSGCGTIFRVTPDGGFTVLYAFAGGTDGARPAGALLQATDGNFYGTTGEGGGTGCGGAGCGTVFQMTPEGTVSVLHAFTGGADGAGPEAALIQAGTSTAPRSVEVWRGHTAQSSK